jgi:hypothetical protein
MLKRLAWLGFFVLFHNVVFSAQNNVNLWANGVHNQAVQHRQSLIMCHKLLSGKYQRSSEPCCEKPHHADYAVFATCLGVCGGIGAIIFLTGIISANSCFEIHNCTNSSDVAFVQNQTLRNSSLSGNSSHRKFSIANDGSSYKSYLDKRLEHMLPPPAISKKNYLTWKNNTRR